MQLAGNQEWGSLEPSGVNFPSGAADVSSHLSTDQLSLFSVHTREKEAAPAQFLVSAQFWPLELSE